MDMNQEITKKIYDLGPLEGIGAKELGGQGFSMLRVPGGWIFIFTQACCFVPFDNEFQAGKDVKKSPRKKAGGRSKKSN